MDVSPSPDLCTSEASIAWYDVGVICEEDRSGNSIRLMTFNTSFPRLGIAYHIAGEYAHIHRQFYVRGDRAQCITITSIR
jgi:hypothetical protein